MTNDFQICLCGTQPGYPHDSACPRPLYGGTREEAEAWRKELLKNTLDSIDEELRTELAPLVGKKVDNELTKSILESLKPVLERIARIKRLSISEELATVTQDENDPTLMHITLAPEFMDGLSAATLRAIGNHVPLEVPDVAVYRAASKRFEWDEIKQRVVADGNRIDLIYPEAPK